MSLKGRILAFLYLSISASSTQGTWRYQSRVGESTLLTTRNLIELEELQADGRDLEWTVSSGTCTLKNKSAAVTDMYCSQPGQYRVSLSLYENGVQMETSSKYITVSKDAGCYHWYMVNISSMSTGSWKPLFSGQNDTDNGKVRFNFRVWIVNPGEMSTQELSNVAIEPSQSSRLLTSQLYSLGQEPAMSGMRYQHYNGVLTAVSLGFQHYGWWEFSVNTSVDQQWQVMINGKPVYLQDCFVRDTVFLVPDSIMTIRSNNQQPLPDHFVGLAARPLVIKDPCMENVALLIKKDVVLLTQDGFHSVEPLLVPLGFSQVSGAYAVTTAAFTPSYLVLLIDAGLYLISRANGSLTKITGLGVDNISGVHSLGCCSEIQNTESETLVAWNDTVVTYGSADNGTFQPVPLPLSMLATYGFQAPEFTIAIEDATVNNMAPHIGTVVNIGGAVNQTLVLSYDLDTEVWTIALAGINNTGEAIFRLEFVKAGQSSYLLWGSQAVYYSYYEDRERGLLELQGCSASNASQLTAHQESIQQFSVNALGEIVFLTSINNLLYGKVGLFKLVKMALGEAEQTNRTVWFDALGQLHIILTSNGSTIEKRPYPLHSEVLGAAYPQVQCPYHHFSTGMDGSTYFLDMGESLMTWVKLVSQEGRLVTIRVLTQKGELLNMSQSEEKQHSSGQVAVNMSLIFYQNKDFSISTDYTQEVAVNTGRMSVEVRPSEVNQACKSPVNKVSYLNVGCPVGRSIRFHHPAPNEACSPVYRYMLSKSWYLLPNGSQPQVDKEVDYDWTTLGCPLKIEESEVLLPKLDLYSGSKLVKALDVDFIVWEQHRRVFSYNATMEQVGCSRLAQSWSQMRSATDDSVDVSSSWGPWNYCSCFKGPETNSDLSGEYEILNGSSIVGITFSTGHHGIYIFTARIVDPNFSYCSLWTRFAVEVYTDAQSPDLTSMGITLLTVAVLLIIALITSYLRFYRITNKSILEEFKALY